MFLRDFESHADRAKCVELQELTWGKGFTEKVPAAMLLVAQKLGGVTAGAFDESGTMLGFVFGVTGVKDGKLVHWSDMLAVRPEAQGTHLGTRLKEYQRDRCRELGIATIYWTYDPLVARNAHLNLNRMGARAVEYVVAMYGEGTNSPLQGDMPTDRFVIDWAVDPAKAAKPLAALPSPLPLAVGDAAHEGELVDAPEVGVRVPRDITALAASDLATARRWRFATRRAFTHYLARGYTVRGFVADDRGGTYLLSR
ncbi:MAG: GNAT family N-acetyltransferase [Gemmatimonadales bacterium]|nr:GNAT family N-acetyltransferase [Gemmatimonadales bacterium]